MTEPSSSSETQKPTSGVRRVSNKRKQTSEAAVTPKDIAPGVANDSGPEEAAQKRPNRRRRNKSKSVAKEAGNPAPETSSQAPAPQTATVAPKSVQEQVKLDPEAVAKKAWKIFLAEVSEEGIALISDNDARELSRRCFRLAQIFLEQQNRA